MPVEPAWQSRVHTFAADHPTAAGHFPGNPIIPGAVLLNEIVAAIGPAHTVRSAKFLTPVRPGDTVVIRWMTAGTDEVRFECRTSDRVAVSGSLTLGAR